MATHSEKFLRELQVPEMAVSVRRAIKLLFLALKSVHFSLVNIFLPCVYGKETARMWNSKMFHTLLRSGRGVKNLLAYIFLGSSRPQ